MHTLTLHADRPTPTARLFRDDSNIRVISLVRLIFALAGLLVLGQAQFVSASRSAAGAIVVFLYVLYSVMLYATAVLRGLRIRRWHWLDVGWGLAVLAGSGGGDSVFQLFFLFPVLVASTLWGIREGLAVLVFSVASSLLVATLALSHMPLPLMLSRALLLAMVGYAIIHWAGVLMQQKRRLLLLQDLNRLPNPRFGPTRLIEASLERLRDFFQADTCLAVLCADSPGCIHVVDRRRTSGAFAGAADLAARLLALPQGLCVCVADGRSSERAPVLKFEDAGAASQESIRTTAGEISASLDAGFWASVPLLLRGETAGRLYVLRQGARFDLNDIQILRQAGGQLMPLVETVTLLDGLVSRAASKERGRLSLDMHDMTIQPYLGLKLGLECIRRKAREDNPLLADLDELYGMTSQSIAELRNYLKALNSAEFPPVAPLLEGIQRQIEQFSRLYGIEAELNCVPDLTLNDRLTAEILPMVGEGLSNVGRHTRSRHVTLNLSVRGENLLCQVVNHGTPDAPPWRPFTPLSLTRRAEQLGGRVTVDRLPDNGSAVTVEIPL